MPCLVINTNVGAEDFPANWHKEMTELVAKLLEKPEKFIVVRRYASVSMTFGGTSGPCATIDLLSIGKLSEADNKPTAAAITEFIERTLKVPKDRMYINFIDMTREMVAWNGQLFSELSKKPSS